MPHSGSDGNLNKNVMKEVKKDHRINITKVDSEMYTDNSDGEEITGSYTGTLYKDENGNAFIYLSTIDGEDVMALKKSDNDKSTKKRKDRDDDDDEDEDDEPRNAGEALDIFMVDRQSSTLPTNAPPGYQPI